jgi:hypothetical protein
MAPAARFPKQPTEATCVSCGRVQSALYPGPWGRSPGLNILLLEPVLGVGLCARCLSPATLTNYWAAIIPRRAVPA